MTISFKVSKNTQKEMVDYFKYSKREKTPNYAVFQADSADTVVTLYESGKVVFQGISADIDATIWKEREKHLNPGVVIEEKNSEKKEKKEKKEVHCFYYTDAIGSDEVGTGDYFGPIVVSAAYVSHENIAFLEKLGVKDSKKLTDDKILEIVPSIIQKIPYESIILHNDEYNQKYSVDIHMNKIKAILHNRVLTKMKEKGFSYQHIIVDEFAKPYIYYRYLKDTNAVTGITFVTKGEDKSLAVACASLISRFIFIREFEKLGESIDMFLPKGAGAKVDEVGAKIVLKYGIDKLGSIAKLNFKNTEKIKELVSKN